MKLAIFDLDGVLVDSKDAHYQALNAALAELAPASVIAYADHLALYDGLPTRKKLALLTARTGLDPALYDAINARKQVLTLAYFASCVRPDAGAAAVFKMLHARGLAVHVASNAVRATVQTILQAKGLLDSVDFVASNEDVSRPKPHAEMYLRCMLQAGVGPRETIVFEDSYVGRQGVYNSGANLGPINQLSDVTPENILRLVVRAEGGPPARWSDTNLNVLIPMAGAGSRFAAAGFTFPKPLIEVRGRPMIQAVVENLAIDAHFIFIVQQAHYDRYSLKTLLSALAPGCDILQVDGMTQGAACTTLLARTLIDSQAQLLIANSDQWMDWDSSDFMYRMQNKRFDGGVPVFESLHPKWSYIKTGPDGLVMEVKEKSPISNQATAGVYYFKRGADYVSAANEMIAANDRVNNEFYVAPTINYLIRRGQRFSPYQIKAMAGLGTPEDLAAFLARP